MLLPPPELHPISVSMEVRPAKTYQCRPLHSVVCVRAVSGRGGLTFTSNAMNSVRISRHHLPEQELLESVSFSGVRSVKEYIIYLNIAYSV